MPSVEDKQYSLSSLRLLTVIETLSETRTPMRLQDIAAKAHMSQSTVLRYLYALIEGNYVYQEEETSRYALTWRLCKLSRNLNTQLSLRGIASPYINDLANTLMRGVCLVVEQDDSCFYLDCIDSPNSQTTQRIGKSAPLHVTASGKNLLSRRTDFQLNEYIKNIGLTQFTPHTITDAEALRKEIVTVRQQDYALDNEECELGLKCISSPLRDYTGQVIASISVFGTIDDMDDDFLYPVVFPALKNATTSISSKLGYVFPKQKH